MVHYHVKDLNRAFVAHDLLRLRVDEVVVAFVLNGFHERLGEAYAYVEVGYLLIICLAVDEFYNIGMVDSQHAHVGASSGSPLLHGFSGRIEHLHEAYRAACNASCGSYRRTALAQPGK